MGLFSESDAVILATRTDADKVQFHIDRFTRAVEQCDRKQKPARYVELKTELAFWRAVQKAAARRVK